MSGNSAIQGSTAKNAANYALSPSTRSRPACRASMSSTSRRWPSLLVARWSPFPARWSARSSPAALRARSRAAVLGKLGGQRGDPFAQPCIDAAAIVDGIPAALCRDASCLQCNSGRAAHCRAGQSAGEKPNPGRARNSHSVVWAGVGAVAGNQLRILIPPKRNSPGNLAKLE